MKKGKIERTTVDLNDILKLVNINVVPTREGPQKIFKLEVEVPLNFVRNPCLDGSHDSYRRREKSIKLSNLPNYKLL